MLEPPIECGIDAARGLLDETLVGDVLYMFAGAFKTLLLTLAIYLIPLCFFTADWRALKNRQLIVSGFLR